MGKETENCILELRGLSLPWGKIPLIRIAEDELVLIAGDRGSGKSLLVRSVLQVESLRQDMQGVPLQFDLKGREQESERLAQEIRNLWRPWVSSRSITLKRPVEVFELKPRFSRQATIAGFFDYYVSLRRLFARSAEIVCSCGAEVPQGDGLERQIDEVLQRFAEVPEGARLLLALRPLAADRFFDGFMISQGFRKGILRGGIKDLRMSSEAGEVEAENSEAVIIWRSAKKGVSREALLREFRRAGEVAEGIVQVYFEENRRISLQGALTEARQCRHCGQLFDEPKRFFAKEPEPTALLTAAYKVQGLSFRQWESLSMAEVLGRARGIADFLLPDDLPPALLDQLQVMLEHSQFSSTMLTHLSRLSAEEQVVLRLLSLVCSAPHGLLIVFDGLFEGDSFSQENHKLVWCLLEMLNLQHNTVVATADPGYVPVCATWDGVTQVIELVSMESATVIAVDAAPQVLIEHSVNKSLQHGSTGKYLFDYYGFAAEVAEALAQTATARAAGFQPEDFLVHGASCRDCNGWGVRIVVLSPGVVNEERCDCCDGTGFKACVLQVRIGGRSIADFFNCTATELALVFPLRREAEEQVSRLKQLRLHHYRLSADMVWLRKSAVC